MAVWCALVAGCGFKAAANIDAAPGTPADAAGGEAAHDDAPLAIDAPVMIDAAPDAMPDAAPLPPVTVSIAVSADTYLDSLQPTTEFGGATTLLVDGATQPATSLLRADFSTIPAGATVTSAELHIWTETDTGSAVGVYKMLQAWDEGTANYRQRMSNADWATDGAGPPSRDTTLLGTITPNNMNTEKTVANLAALVQGWVTTPASNLGIAIASNQSDGSTYHSRNSLTATRRPYFVVTYQP